MTLRQIFPPFFLLFVLIRMELWWDPMDSEAASIANLEAQAPLLAAKWLLLATLAGLALFYRSLGNPIRRLGVLPCALLAFGGASILWSYNVSVSGYAFLSLVVVYGYALTAPRMIGANVAMRIMWMASFAVIMVSVALAAANSPYAIMNGYHEGAWRGVFAHKNSFGPFIVAHIMLTLFGRKQIGLPLAVAVTIVLGEIALLGLVRSATAIAASAAGLGAGLTFWPIRNRGLRRLWQGLCIVAIVAAAGILLMMPEVVANTLGRAELTGNRSVLWETAYRESWKDELGTGLGTIGGTPVSTALQLAVHRKDVQGPQSGYLALALDLGWGAVTLYAAWILSIMAQLVIARRATPWSALLASLVATQIIEGITETKFGFSANWILALILIALVALRDDLTGAKEAWQRSRSARRFRAAHLSVRGGRPDHG